VERGRKLAGTRWSGAIADLIGAGLRQHTTGTLYERVSQSAKGRSRAH
jgi:hypothetical protein